MSEETFPIEISPPSAEDQELAKLLLEKLPPEIIAAAKICLRILKFQEKNLTPLSTDSLTDLLYKSIWFADNHANHPKIIESVFSLFGRSREIFGPLGLNNRLNSLYLGGLIVLEKKGDFNSGLKLSAELEQKAEQLLVPDRLD